MRIGKDTLPGEVSLTWGVLSLSSQKRQIGKIVGTSMEWDWKVVEELHGVEFARRLRMKVE